MTAHRPGDHNHDHGLQHDLEMITKRLHEQRLRERRRLLGWLLSGGTAAALVACGGGGGSDGPYPSDGSNSVDGTVSNILSESGVVRSDIRSSFGSSTTTAPGVPLVLTINLVNTNASCAVLSDYAIYIWHCDRDGEYSLYGSDILDENFLRGVQVTDSNGQVTFTTIFPACYSGRYPHIHIEVYPSLAAATIYSNAVLTSQMAMPADICTTVFDDATGYSASVTNFASVTTSTDSVFSTSTAAQIAAQTPSVSGSVADGFTGTITVGLDV